MYLAVVKSRRVIRRWPLKVWRSFWAPLTNAGQMIALVASLIGLFFALKKTPLFAWWDKVIEWLSPVPIYALVLLGWGVVCAIAAPFLIIVNDRRNGSWQRHHYIYKEPRLVFTGRFEHKDGATQVGSLDLKDAEPGSFAFCKVEADPNVLGRIQLKLNGGKPSPQIVIQQLVPRMVTMTFAPGAHVGIRLPKDRSATVYVRLEPMTTPVIIRVYCIEFFVGQDESNVGSGLWEKAMTNLRKARGRNLDDFVAEHENDPEGDADKLDALLKTPVQETVKAVRKASSPASSDD
jgi:hypothetical protein